MDMLDMTIAEMLLIVLIANILRRLIVDRLDRQRIENYIADI